MTKQLFKYRGLKSPFWKSLVAENEIYFSSPLDFNDPFDCRILVPYLDGTEEQILGSMERSAPQHIKMLPRGERERIFRRTLQQLPRTEEEKRAYERRILCDSVKDVGVYSVSTVHDNIQMWAYYADSHSGICVGFDLDLFVDSIRGSGAYPEEVKYSNEYPRIDPYGDNDQYSKIFYVKDKGWSHENEHRVIWYGHPNEALKLKPRTITSIYLGANIKPSSKAEVLEVIQSLSFKPSIYLAKTARREFKIEFELIG